MRTFLLDLLRFLLLALTVHIVSVVAVGTVSPQSRYRNIKFARGGYGHLHSRLKEVDTTRDVDILFLGSSHAYRSFDPRIMRARGLHTFVLGSSHQSPVQTRMLLERHLDALSPTLVVMDVFAMTVPTEGEESALNVISNTDIRWDMVRMALHTPSVSVLNTLVVAGWRQLVGADRGYREPAYLPADMDAYIPGGYVQKGPIPFKGTRDPQPLDRTVPAFQQEAFQDVIEMFGSTGVPVVLVQTPVTSGFRYTAEERAFLRARFEPYGTYLDLSDLFPVDDTTLFYDGHHMRQRGVEHFDRVLLDSLHALGLLPNSGPPHSK